MTAWRPVVGWPDYEISDDGQIRSLKFGRIKVMRHRLLPRGYHQVRLSSGGRQAHPYIHSLVLESFVGPRPLGNYCRHLDGNPHNNHLSNLAWGTQTENNWDISIHGRNHNVNKTHCIRGHRLSGENLYVAPPGSPGNRPKRSCNACRIASRKRTKGNSEAPVIRNWARANGYVVADAGRIPKEVHAAYAAAREQKAAAA